MIPPDPFQWGIFNNELAAFPSYPSSVLSKHSSKVFPQFPYIGKVTNHFHQGAGVPSTFPGMNLHYKPLHYYKTKQKGFLQKENLLHLEKKTQLSAIDSLPPLPSALSLQRSNTNYQRRNTESDKACLKIHLITSGETPNLIKLV